MTTYDSVFDFLSQQTPDKPVVCYRPHAAARAVRWFIDNFPGDVLYALKANASPTIVQAIYAAGIRHFDVTSLAEINLLAGFSGVHLYYMNPVKHPEHIRRAYFDHGVRHFALDTHDELEKILAATGRAQDLSLHVRIAVNNRRSRLPLGLKYGVKPQEAPALLVAARLRARHLGVCFHVGSQCMDPSSYERAIARANRLIRRAGVFVDSLDVGGGFPAAYPALETPPLIDYIQAIEAAFEESLTSYTCRLLCEPGRALVAESGSLLVNVMLRKGDYLYINDGAYGALFDAAHLNFPYPVRAIRAGRPHRLDKQSSYRLFGPTCDSIDYIPGPFLLPADMQAGDYIEIGQLGAYGEVMRTDFNGFGARDVAVVVDEPMMSLYSGFPQDTGYGVNRRTSLLGPELPYNPRHRA
jgi:ornithine decarboxylase